MSPRALVNALSLSRVGLGLLFVLTFQRHAVLLYISIAICALALLTDLLDGYLARRLDVASIDGRLWDSLGDKAFYVAVIIGFNTHGFLSPLISWALIVREVALYITRILFIDRLARIEEIRPWTNWHGYFMYLTILFGLFRMYVEIHDLPFQIGLGMQLSALMALAFGAASIHYFIKLE